MAGKSNSPTAQMIDFNTDRWLMAVLDLVKLTNQGNLRWNRVNEDTPTSEYEATFNNSRLHLQVPYVSPFSGLRQIQQGIGIVGQPPKKTYEYPRLRVYSGGELTTSFPDIVALNGLREAIERQLQEKDFAFLDAIHKVAHQ